MDGDKIGDIIEHKEKVFRERSDRDKFYLLATRNKIMKDLATDTNEWITEEIKEQLEMIDLIKKLDNDIIVNIASAFEKRIKKIRKTYRRTIISPMNKLSKRKASSVTEYEHYAKITQAMQNCNNIVLELLEYRIGLDSFTRVDEGRAELCPQPNMTSETVPDGLYS